MESDQGEDPQCADQARGASEAALTTTPDLSSFRPPWYVGRSAEELWRKWALFRALAPEDPAKAHPWSTAKQREALLDVLRLIQRNPAFLLHEFMDIRTKEGGRRRFDNWTPAQRRFYVESLRQYASGQPVRTVILKARQMGISTLCEGMLFWRTAFFRDATSIIVAHEEEAVNNIYGMFRLYFESLPDLIKPLVDKFNQSEIVFDQPKVKLRKSDPGMGSRLIVKTAALGGSSKANAGKGRSATYHAAHCSEAAFWAEPATFWGGLSQGIPDARNTWVFVESTANGVGNWFHDFWRRAADGWDMRPDDKGRPVWQLVDPSARRSAYLPVFLSWLEHPGYQVRPEGMPIDVSTNKGIARYVKDYDEDERKLSDRFGATPYQIEWRRRTIADKCDGDLHMFHQEYPVLPEEAFVSSGRKVFDVGAMKDYERAAWDRSRSTVAQRVSFDVDASRVDSQDRAMWTLKNDPDGPVQVWALPQPGRKYVIGADSCYGKPNGDYACGQVVDLTSWEQVACLHGRLPPEDFAELLHALAGWYNDALVVPEINGPGISVLNRLQALGQWNMYRRIEFDGVKRKPKPSWGWTMSAKARSRMVDELKSAVRNRRLVLNDPDTIREMREWIVVSNPRTGKAKEMPSGGPYAYDDRITALGIALVGGVLDKGMGGALVSKTVADSEGTAETRRLGFIDPEALNMSSSEEAMHPVLGTCF